jgi:hypothetical protein
MVAQKKVRVYESLRREKVARIIRKHGALDEKIIPQYEDVINLYQ